MSNTKTIQTLCQHSGNFGPWYHVSTYTRVDGGCWKFTEKSAHHLNSRRAREASKEMGIGFGRPCN